MKSSEVFTLEDFGNHFKSLNLTNNLKIRKIDFLMICCEILIIDIIGPTKHTARKSIRFFKDIISFPKVLLNNLITNLKAINKSKIAK